MYPEWHFMNDISWQRQCLLSRLISVRGVCPQCVEQLSEVQAGLQDSVKELTKSRKKYQETEVLAQAVREKAELEAKYVLLLLLLLV